MGGGVLFPPHRAGVDVAEPGCHDHLALVVEIPTLDVPVAADDGHAWPPGPEADAASVCDALAEAGIAVAPIARAVPAERGLEMRTSEGTSPLPRFDQDEIARLF